MVVLGLGVGFLIVASWSQFTTDERILVWHNGCTN